MSQPAERVYATEFYYDVPVSNRTLTHVYRAKVRVEAGTSPAIGADPTQLNLESPNGLLVTLQDFAQQRWDVISPLFGSAVSLARVDFQLFPFGIASAATYITSADLGLFANTSGNSFLDTVTPAQQTTFTFRTDSGRIVRHQFVEVSSNSNFVESFPSGTPALDNFFSDVISDATPDIGNFDDWVELPLRASNGQNEKIFRERFR